MASIHIYLLESLGYIFRQAGLARPPQETVSVLREIHNSLLDVRGTLSDLINSKNDDTRNADTVELADIQVTISFMIVQIQEFTLGGGGHGRGK